MPKPNVDLVTLLAINELVQATNPDKTWRFPVSNPTVGNKIANWMSIETAGAIISDQIGAAINRPDRVYLIVDDGEGNLIADGLPDVVIEADGDGLFNILNDTYLDGWEYSIHRRPVEYLVKGPEWQNDIPGGGFRLTQASDQFYNGDIITASFKPRISNILVTPDAVARFTNGVQVITANTTLTASFQRKVLLLNSATSTLSVTLDAGYPENVLCVMMTGSGNQVNTLISAPGGQNIVFNGTRSNIILGTCEFVHMVRVGTSWYVTAISDGWQRVGQVVMGGVPGPNVISANGQTLQRVEHRRADSYLDVLEAELPGSVVSVAAWATNKTRWARDANVIIVPQLGGQFPRFLDLGAGVDPDRSVPEKNQVGSAQTDQVGEVSITINIPKGDSYNGNPYDTNILGRGNTLRGDMSITATANEGEENRPLNVGLPALIYV